MVKDLVSIITPCYNGEMYVERILSSIINQTYPNIQFIFINDGSTDKTEEIVKKHQAEIKKRGYDFIYIYKENGGQASAINIGLKYATGEYLTWPDADDELTSDSIQRKVEYLKQHQEVGFVISEAYIIEEKSGKNIGELKRKHNYPGNIFENLVLQKDIWFAPGTYMVRMDKFVEVNPSKHIYESRGGQNWQMLLPIAFKYNCGYLPEKLYKYYVRENSHSHYKGNFEKEIQQIEFMKDILLHELKNLNVLDKYKENVYIRYYKDRLNVAFKYRKLDIFLESYKYIKGKNSLNLKMIVKKIIMLRKG